VTRPVRYAFRTCRASARQPAGAPGPPNNHHRTFHLACRLTSRRPPSGRRMKSRHRPDPNRKPAHGPLPPSTVDRPPPARGKSLVDGARAGRAVILIRPHHPGFPRKKSVGTPGPARIHKRLYSSRNGAMGTWDGQLTPDLIPIPTPLTRPASWVCGNGITWEMCACAHLPPCLKQLKQLTPEPSKPNAFGKRR